jgi:hypothetical protein
MANFQHREYLGTVAASTGFSLQKYSVNPGVSSTFPWLGQVANNFEKYKINRMSFVFNSTASDSVTNGSNSSVGVLILGASYDSADPDFASRFEMLNYRGTRSQKLSSSFQFPVDTRMFQQQNLWVRDGPPPANTDIRLYDACTFYLATDAAQGIFSCGELWVVYDIDLMGPKLYDTLGLASGVTHWEGPSVTSASPLAASTSTTGAYEIVNTLGAWMSPDVEGSFNWNTLHFPCSVENQYMYVTCTWRDSTGATVAGRQPPGLQALVNCSVPLWVENNTADMKSNNGQTTNILVFHQLIKITDPTPGKVTKLTFSSVGAFSTNMTCVTVIAVVPYNFGGVLKNGSGKTTNIDKPPTVFP